MKDINKLVKKLRKNLKNEITIPNLITYLDSLGYATVFFNTEEGNDILKAYDLSYIKEDAFVYCGTTKILFIDNNLSSNEKLYSILHELGHIELNHLDDNKSRFMDKCEIENEAEAFAYAVLNYKENYKPLYFAICLVLASAISATTGYNLHPDTVQKPKQHSVFVANNITQSKDITETQAPVITENNTELVYVTKTGSRYHKPNCRYVKNNSTATAIQAEKAHKSYTPCKVCNP